MHRSTLTSLTLAATIGVLNPVATIAHGTSDPGPHGGEIRMPGAFHVEVAAEQERLRVYLLDMQFEQPRVKNSSVEATLERDGETTRLSCTQADDIRAFKCSLPAEASLDEGTLVVEASRDGLPAEPARYDLPLAWSDG